MEEVGESKGDKGVGFGGEGELGGAVWVEFEGNWTIRRGEVEVLMLINGIESERWGLSVEGELENG